MAVHRSSVSYRQPLPFVVTYMSKINKAVKCVKNVKYIFSITALFVPEDSREIINLDVAVFVVYNI